MTEQWDYHAPWGYDRQGYIDPAGYPWDIIVNASGGAIAQSTSALPENTRLIAAAPLLLDAIVDALSDFEEHGLHAKECECAYCTGIARLQRAYEKATGQQ